MFKSCAGIFFGFLILVFANKHFNISRILGFDRYNNYIDYVISGFDLILIFFCGGLIIQLLIRSQKSLGITMLYSNDDQLLQIAFNRCHSELSVVILPQTSLLGTRYYSESKNVKIDWGSSITVAFGIIILSKLDLLLGLQLLRFIALVVAVGYWYAQTKDQGLGIAKNILIVIIFAYSMVDHLLISSSIPVVILLCFIFLKHKNYSISLLVLFVINLVFAIYQVFYGRSLGFWVEPMVSLDIVSQVAKQGLWDSTIILRGYGLTQHPNILGFVGVVGYYFCASQTKSKYANEPSNPMILQNQMYIQLFSFVSILLIFLSFSRIAFLSLFVIFLWQSYTTRLVSGWNIFKSYLAKCFLIISILAIFVTRKDVSRFNDISLWMDSISKMSIIDVVIGVGYYPSFLLQKFVDIDSWRITPVHNIWLNLLIQLGLFGFLALIFGLILILQKIFPKNSFKTTNNNL